METFDSIIKKADELKEEMMEFLASKTAKLISADKEIIFDTEVISRGKDGFDADENVCGLISTVEGVRAFDHYGDFDIINLSLDELYDIITLLKTNSFHISA